MHWAHALIWLQVATIFVVLLIGSHITNATRASTEAVSLKHSAIRCDADHRHVCIVLSNRLEEAVNSAHSYKNPTKLNRIQLASHFRHTCHNFEQT